MQRKLTFTIALFLLTASTVWAQHFLTFGIGFSSNFYESDDLSTFKDTYNIVNAENLAQPLEGVGGGALGLGAEIGYRYYKKLNAGVRAGWQTSRIRDRAQYGNTESRNIEYRVRHFYLETELGRSFSNYFINGLVALFFNRDIEAESEYTAPTNEAEDKALNGTYRGDAAFSADIGVVFGIYKAPFLVLLRVSYPVYTGGDSSILRDDSPEKVSDNTARFPRDYFEYLNGGNYSGVRSTIDGLKVSITTAFALPI